MDKYRYNCMSQQVFNTKPFKEVFHANHLDESWKAAGISVPVFSLRSDYGFGIGEFPDLKTLADWCVITGLKIIQILPINDTTATGGWSDSYPYKSISINALHPIYLNLSEMGALYDESEKERFEILRKDLNTKEFVNYPEVMAAKKIYFKKIFEQTWNEVKERADYQKFFKENRRWLVPYAAFCFLRDKFNTADFHLWGEYSIYDKEKIESLCKEDSRDFDKIAIHYFLQYHLDKQLRDAVNYLHDKEIALKGDIAIGISPYSVEAWTEPELFKMEMQAGAPPDSFSTSGQNWGFPTYNWDAMAKDDYLWWRQRLQQMSRYFDLYRIDHILGFFRIWEIPKDSRQGIMGHFCPALPFSADDIRWRGVNFDESRMAKPYIRGHFLRDFFGDYADEARMNYLNELSYSIFELKPEFDNQKKIEDYFDKNFEHLTEKETVIRNGLIGLTTEVLFVRDPYTEHPAYHPRIALQYTYSYRELDDYQKDAINRLYDDFFYHRHDEFWRQEALKKLPTIIHAGNMLVCGEDLGMVPSCVPEVMQQLNILSLEVQRMPKDPRREFVDPAHNPYLSVDTTSTHDMPTIRGWWEEDGGAANRFYHEMLGHWEGAPYFAEPYVCQEIVNQHLHSSSMLVILPIQDYLAMDGTLRWEKTWEEQINVPSNPENHWRYRMQQKLEALLKAKDFNKTIRAQLRCASRARGACE